MVACVGGVILVVIVVVGVYKATVHSVPTEQPRTTLTGSAEVEALAFSPDGKTLASAGRDNLVRLWNLNSHQQSVVPAGHIYALAFSPDGKTLATVQGGEGPVTVRLWNITTHQQISHFNSTVAGTIEGATFSPDGTTLAMVTGRPAVLAWDVATHRTLAVKPAAVQSVTLAHDTHHKMGPVKLQLWDVSNGQQIAVLNGLVSDGADVLAFNIRDGHAASRSVLRLLDPAGRRQLAALTSVVSTYSPFAVSPDGATLAATGLGVPLRLYDVANYRKRAELVGYDDSMARNLCFSPDGKFLAAVDDTRIRLWPVRKT